MYPVLSFACTFISTFHSSEQNYSNLYTCAPYVLGSSLRGAVLRALIDLHCTALNHLHQDNPGYHAICQELCPVKPLFNLPTRFSFGWFEEEKPHTKLQTRVGIDRGCYSAAKGALLSTEVRYGPFSFSVMLPDAGLQDKLEEAVRWAGSRLDGGGVGRFRSIGWGRFEARPCKLQFLVQASHDHYRFRFRTPYVLDHSIQEGSVPKLLLEKQLRGALENTGVDLNFSLKEAEIRVASLSYIRRWSDAQHQKENRLVAGPGTELEVTFNQPVTQEQLELWQWGIGEWLESGFGSFEAIPV